MAINTEKRYCGLCGIRISGLTNEQSKMVLKHLQDKELDDENTNYLVKSLGFYRIENTVDTGWIVTIYMYDSSYNVTTEIPWFAGKNICSMYLNFRERNKRFDRLIEDVLRVINSV